MKYLLDTNICIYIIKKKPPEVLQKFTGYPVGEIGLSSITVAATALSDPISATGSDPDHSISEYRYITFGVSERGRLLVVAHTEAGDTVRIISDRVACKGERKIYEEG